MGHLLELLTPLLVRHVNVPHVEYFSTIDHFANIAFSEASHKVSAKNADSEHMKDSNQKIVCVRSIAFNI